jgi:ubiquinone/menaquinone biosynthesis C-methylase UbiE
MPQNSTEFTSTIAEIYDKYLAPVFFISTSKDLVTYIPEKPAKILELAAGTGRVTRVLAEQYPDTEITATDLNPGMLSLAKKIVLSPRIKWNIVDACDIPYDDNTFDVIICQFGIMFFPDKPKAVSEAYRVLKPGGTIIFNTWDSLQNNRICQIADEVVKSVFTEDPPQFYHIPFSMYIPEEITGLMQNAGFKDVKVEHKNIEGFSDSPENAVKAFTEGNPIYLQIQERDELALGKIQAMLLHEFRKEYGNSSFKIPLSEFITTARK